MPHTTRAPHAARHPLHVTLRRRAGLPSLRGGAAFRSLKDALAAASSDSFRVLQFSVQRDHVHLIVEANDRATLTRGMRGLAIRMALGLNRRLARRGAVWDDRYHARRLATPREVRNAIAYVLLNWRKHIADAPDGVVDRCSSGSWFDGWQGHPFATTGPPLLPSPHTWLATVGWRRCGLLRLDERPAKRVA